MKNPTNYFIPLITAGEICSDKHAQTEGETTLRFAKKVLDFTKEYQDQHLWTEQEIKYLLEVEEQGRISAAAEKLFVAQPSLSQKLWQI